MSSDGGVGGSTFSAVENFLLALRIFPHMVVVGTKTSGENWESGDLTTLGARLLEEGRIEEAVVLRVAAAEVTRSLGKEERALEAYRQVLRIDREHLRARETVPPE